MPTTTTWDPPTEITRDQIVRGSEEILGRPDLPLTVTDDVFRLRVLELDWDIGGQVYQPEEPARIPTGADGKRVGVFLLHGGAGDHRGKDRMARFLAGRLGYKVATMTYPGKLYLLDPSRDWPGDTINPDGTARTPLWQIERPITPDQYELVQDRSNPVFRAKWGAMFFLKAKEGTEFYDRMAAWPLAYEEAMKAVCARNFPPAEFSIYAHGHSTGGPFVHMLLQRVDNIAGLIGMESSPFGSIFSQMLGMKWEYSFNYLTIRTWRHIAKYAGVEAGPEGMWRLPWIMEDVLEAWDRAKSQPQFKAEYIVTYGATEPLAAAARATARRLELGDQETADLIERFTGYARELSGPGVRPVPPLLYGIAQGSRDHTAERYETVVLPTIAAMTPPPKATLVQFQGGVHGYERAEADLPRGLLPAVVKLWDDAIGGGYYLA
ncbi:MAG: hypothetical protein ACRDJN_29030 [Chloroflexota bacterium]